MGSGGGSSQLGCQIVLGQAVAKEVKGLFRSVGELKQLEVLGRNGSRIHQGVEIENLLPVVGTVNQDGDLLGQFVGLGQGEDLEHFIERAEAAGEHHQRLRQIGKPQFAHEEVVELEVERGRDVGIGRLLEGQPDVQPDGLSAGLASAAVGGFHNAGAAAGGDDEAVLTRGNLEGPAGEQLREAARVLVVASHFNRRNGALALQIGGFAGGYVGWTGWLLVAGRGLLATPRAIAPPGWGLPGRPSGLGTDPLSPFSINKLALGTGGENEMIIKSPRRTGLWPLACKATRPVPVPVLDSP